MKWTCERREAFLTDYQARDLVSEMELALDADGNFLALRGVNTSNVGAHAVTFVPLNNYAIPRADMLPAFTTEISEVPSASNPLGLRGGGEGGATPAFGAVINAIVDALAELGVEHVEMPATPERVWRAIRAAEGRP